MSRLMTGVLLVALTLAVTMAWAQRGDNGVGDADIITYAGDPPAVDDGFPLDAHATFKAHVLAYAHLAIDPPKDLYVPGDNPDAGTPGEDSIEPEDAGEPNPDAGLITAEINTDCTLTVEVSEFTGDDVSENLWTEYSLGTLMSRITLEDPGWAPVEVFLVDDGWFQVVDGFHSFGDPDEPVGIRAGEDPPIGNGGTVVIDAMALDPVLDGRYWRLPFGVKAKNRIDDEGDFDYETIALEQDYTADMWVTIAAP